MKSLYFDDSLYENEMHYRISNILDEMPLDDDKEEIVIKCNTSEEYNSVLDALYHYGIGKVNIYGVTNNPMEIIVEKDPRDGYRKFKEDQFLISDEEKQK